MELYGKWFSYPWNLTEKCWQLVLPEVLDHCRVLLQIHEHFLSFSRRSSHNISLPFWLMSLGPLQIKRFVRNNKTNPYVDQVKLLKSNSTYTNMKYSSGRESTVYVCDLAPCPETELLPESSKMKPNKSNPVVPVLEEDTTSKEDVAGVQ